MARSVFVRPASVFYEIIGGDGASTSDSLQPEVSCTPTKFYVKFTITPVHEFHFLLTRRRRIFRNAAVERGVVLERDAFGRFSTGVWIGVAFETMAGAMGLSAALTETVAKELADLLVDLGRGQESVPVRVEIDVVTPLVVALDEVVDAASVPAATREVAALEACGFCQEALTRDMVVRRAHCLHHFHWDCFGLLMSSVSRSCPRCNYAFPV